MDPVPAQRHSSRPCTGIAAQQWTLMTSRPLATATRSLTNHTSTHSFTNHNNINSLIYQSQHQLTRLPITTSIHSFTNHITSLIYQSQHQLTPLPITTSTQSFPTQSSDFPSTSVGHQSVWPFFSTGTSKYPAVFNSGTVTYLTQFSVLGHQSIQQFLTARDQGIRPSFLF